MASLLMLFALVCGLGLVCTLGEDRYVVLARAAGVVTTGTERRLTRVTLPGSTLVVGLGAAGVLVCLAWLGPVSAGIGLLALVAFPRIVRRNRVKREAERLETQLADGVSTIASSLRAGLSLLQAMRVTAHEAPPPLSRNLARVVDRASMGVPLAEALQAWARDGDGADVRLVASVLQIHRRTGGDLPLVLDGVAQTLRERNAQTRESRSLTAQARLSGMVLGLLPIGFFLFLSVMSPADMAAAYHSSAGLSAIFAGIVLQLGAFLWIRHLLKVGE